MIGLELRLGGGGDCHTRHGMICFNDNRLFCDISGLGVGLCSAECQSTLN